MADPLRSSGLKRNPEGVRAWTEKSRERARERERERQERRAAGLSTRTRSGRRKAALPKGLRTQVVNRTYGICTTCLHREGIDATRLSIAALHRLVSQGRLRLAVQLHHVLPEQRYRHLALKPWNLIGICPEEHYAHEFAPNYRIPRSALPAETIDGADEQGLGWYIEENYP